MMISSQTAIYYQNQMTIDYIKARKYQDAIVSASSALQYFRFIESMRQEHFTRKSSSRPQITYDQCMLLTDIPEGTIENKDIHGCLPFLYDHGISLPTNISLDDAETITHILVFNTALAHHLLVGHSDDQTSILFLRKAYKLYELAYNAHDIDGNPLFQFAIINNMAVIDRLLTQNMEAWNARMDYLMSLYVALMDRGCTSFVRRMKGFLVNAMPSSPVARAA